MTPSKKIKELLKIPRRPMQLNQGLLKRQKISKEEEEIILDLHDERVSIFEKMERLSPKHKEELRMFAQKIEEIEFKLQKAWKFPLDREKHNWWYRVPHCLCSKILNCNVSPRRYKPECPIHGK